MPVELRSMTTSPAPGRITKPSGRAFQQHQRRGSISSTTSRSSSMNSIPSRPNSPFTRPSILPLTPDTSRPGSPLNNARQTSHSSRRQTSSKTSLVALVAPPTPGSITGDPMVVSEPESLSLAMDSDHPTVTWDTATAVVSSQKVHTTYEKPTYSTGTQFDQYGEMIEGTGHILQYGKVLTKTVTMTVTTTIASTEVLRPGEDGYEASRKRQRMQQQQQQQAQQDTQMSNINHESYHTTHHHEARPVPLPSEH